MNSRAIPKRVLIDGRWWAVERESIGTISKDNARPARSDANYELRRIRIGSELPPAEAWTDLCHEVLHVAWWNGNRSDVPIDLSSLEETIIERFERGLYPILRDNFGFGPRLDR